MTIHDVNNPLFKRSDLYKRKDKGLKVYDRDTTTSGKHIFPLSLQMPGQDNQFWTFPIEPTVSVSASNTIVKRKVAKHRGLGTIKERWTEDDIKISIKGVLIGQDGKYPGDDVERLRNICNQDCAIKVQNDFLKHFGVSSIVVESYEMPFSIGENIQSFTINAISDDDYSFLDDSNG